MIETVIIPASDQHKGIFKTAIRLLWNCPRCGGPRGEISEVLSFDGSLKMGVDGWTNPCGHIDKYSSLLIEAKENGYNVIRCNVENIIASQRGEDIE